MTLYSKCARDLRTRVSMPWLKVVSCRGICYVQCRVVRKYSFSFLGNTPSPSIGRIFERNSKNPKITHVPIKGICWRVDYGYFENRHCFQFFENRRALRKNYILLPFLRFWYAVFCILLITKLSIKILEQIVEFSPQNFFTAR